MAIALPVGAAAAAVCFVLNRALFARIGYRTVIVWSPVLEESAKTLLAYGAGADIFAVHVVFGAIEGGYDWMNGGAKGAWAAVLSLAGHALFGLAAAAAWSWSGGVFLSLAAGCALHLLWNIGVVKFV